MQLPFEIFLLANLKKLHLRQEVSCCNASKSFKKTKCNLRYQVVLKA